ncbi:MAG: hypothetical protein F4X08_02765 [Gemmatimonadetes bacterium]|nr:hypothetical protein [Gemmatimonadota bacterium]MYD24719.1 hypothetical protein [Gemmatimonadota bacterium]MYI98269.1 hypothetical protein [Gemmatimonadota bacterium]
MSEYQNLKLVILSILEISKDAVHIHVGLLVFFAAVILWRKGSIDVRCLIPVVIVTSLMELLDLRDDYTDQGFIRMAALTASIHDLINTMLWPVVIVVLAWLGKLKGRPTDRTTRRLGLGN